MKYLKRFNEDITATIKSDGNIKPGQNIKTNIIDTIYDKRWENELPEYSVINYKGELFKFKKDNIMLHSDMIQITYSSVPGDTKTSTEQGEIWGAPDTLEFDIYFAKDDKDGNITLTVDITYGDAMVSEFTVKMPGNIEIIHYTGLGSKYDKETFFGFEDQSIKDLVNFFNRLGFELEPKDFTFLDKEPDSYIYTETIHNMKYIKTYNIFRLN